MTPTFRFPGHLCALLAAVGLVLATSGYAQAHSADETKEDVARHRAIAAAHLAAAQCLESGKGESMCYKDLLAACKGIAIGKYCGMRHGH
jgi:hypothetical protein